MLFEPGRQTGYGPEAAGSCLRAGEHRYSRAVHPETLLSAFDGGSSFCPEELWLTWTASTDGAEPASAIEYEVRVNGTIIDVIPSGTQTVSYTEVLGANTVTIVAVDRAGDASAPSNPITVFTNWGPGGCGL